MLTDAAVKSAKAGSKVYKAADSGGLYLFVPNGSRSWRWTTGVLAADAIP